MKRYIDHRSKKTANIVESQDEVPSSKNSKYNLPKIPKPEYKMNVNFHLIMPNEIMKIIGMNNEEYDDFLMILSLYDDYNNKVKWSKLKSVYINIYISLYYHL